MNLSHGLMMLLMVFSLSAVAAPNNGRGQSTDHAASMSLGRAVDQVRQQYNGRVLSAETLPPGRNRGKESAGRDNGTHQIRVLTDDGRVRRLRFDAGTGRPLNPGR